MNPQVKEKLFNIFLVIFAVSCLAYAVFIYSSAAIEYINRYDEEKHICLDWGCKYMNPFGEDSILFTTSQIEEEQCPKHTGEYCVEIRDEELESVIFECIPLPLREEICIDWEKK